MDGGATSKRRRLLVVTPGSVRNSYLSVREHYDFFPADCVGPPNRRANGTGVDIEILLDGLNEAIKTDIGTNAKTGAPRGIFRRRPWVRRFFEHHGVHAGDQLALERLGTRRYRLSIDRSNGRSFTAAEFFSGIGLVRLALERQGWHVAFANNIEPDKAEMYRHNWPKDDHLVVGDSYATALRRVCCVKSTSTSRRLLRSQCFDDLTADGICYLLAFSQFAINILPKRPVMVPCSVANNSFEIDTCGRSPSFICLKASHPICHIRDAPGTGRESFAASIQSLHGLLPLL